MTDDGAVSIRPSSSYQNRVSILLPSGSRSAKLTRVGPTGPIGAAHVLRNALTKRLTIRGFIVFDFEAGDLLTEVGGWVREGRIHSREDIREGLETAPSAFIGLLDGENFGKLLIRVAPDPTR